MQESAAFNRGYRDAGQGKKIGDIVNRKINDRLKLHWVLGWYQYFIEHPPFPNDPVQIGPDKDDPLLALWVKYE